MVFLGAGNSTDIENDTRGVARLLSALAPEVCVIRVIDRDDRTGEEIQTLQTKNVRVLSRRTIESYLLDDSVLQSLCEKFEQPEVVTELLAAKTEAIRNSISNGGPTDDLKRAAGDIYNSAKRLFPSQKLGSDKRAFMKQFCTHMVRQVAGVYEELRRGIFGE